MSDDPMAAALARLHAEHPDLPTDGGRVWEPVQDEAEPAEYREVWDSELPPGGLVCNICGQPVESEPCPDHARTADR